MADLVQSTVASVEGSEGHFRLLRDVPISDVQVFYQELLAAKSAAEQVTIDCADIEYLCGPAWQVLLSFKIELGQRAGQLRLKNVSSKLHRAAQVLGLDSHLCAEVQGASS